MSHVHQAAAHARSFLYVPGDDPRKLASANRSDADVIVADLEDAVVAARKDDARHEVVRFAAERAPGPPLLVRINGVQTPFVAEDTALVVRLMPAGVVLPKAHADDLQRLDVGAVPVLAMLEDGRGVRDAYEIAGDPRVVRLGLGAVDLAVDLRLSARDDGLELLHVRSRLVVDSAAADIAGPVDTPFVHYRDEAGLRRDCEIARSLGFTGKACIHPAQAAVVREVFSPTSDEVAWASRVVEAFEAAARGEVGVTAVAGEMIDQPVVDRACAIIQHAKGENT